MKKYKEQTKKRELGQSLVELALVLPILLVLLAGTVEVSNILITKNRVETAARAAARHASNGGDDVEVVALNSVTQTLDLNPDLWDIWTIDAHVNPNGTGFNTGDWTVTHIYGSGHTNNYTNTVTRLDPNCLTDCVSGRILSELQRDEQANQNTAIAADLDIVGVYVIHDIDSILGLNAIRAYQGFTSVEGLGVMRKANQSIVDTTEGCTVVFPFGVSQGRRSITQGTYENVILGQMDYPTPKPAYYSFSYHNPDVSLLQATEGDIFRFPLDGSGDGMAWLQWNRYLNSGSATLAHSLAWPGDSFDYSNCSLDTPACSGAPLPPNSFPAWGFAEPGDVDDKAIHAQDRVTANLSASISDPNVRSVLNDHIDNRRALRVPIFGENFPVLYLADGTPYYEIVDFGIFRLRAYSISDNWILMEYVGTDSSCGQS